MFLRNNGIHAQEYVGYSPEDSNMNSSTVSHVAMCYAGLHSATISTMKAIIFIICIFFKRPIKIQLISFSVVLVAMAI
jgi:hypothetical protein